MDIREWNRLAMERARIKREEEWNERMERHRNTYQRPEPKVPTLWDNQD